MAANLQTDYSALAKLKPAVRFTLPSKWMFKIPPAALPATLPVPGDHPTLAHPFKIPTNLYNAALEPVVPVTIAIVYVTFVWFLNGVNKRRKYQPWAISKTSLFKSLVILHNTFLALYSLWTFIGMLNALNNSLYWPWEPFGFAGTVDSLCKVNGPRGVGSAARYNPETSTWSIANRFFKLGADGLGPESTDVGRLWNEGLAFYGWLFYLSKFYEVLDTMIILAKGKKSSVLQTYHHAGAMFCMWAGIRYMSAPIWMFCFVNSFIHAIMYTFYLCSALRIRIPVWFKRTLTTMQITQFVIGAAFAFAHFFIKYQSPISTAYTHHFGEIASSVVADATSAASIATASASADVLKYAKKALLRAAGREGLAQNVLNDRGQTFGLDAEKAAKVFARREETRYRDELTWTHCIDTSGQAFAIYINVLYLLPLTWLFGRFFVRSYLKRLERRRSSTAAEKMRLAAESARDAVHGTRRKASTIGHVQGDDTDNENAVIDSDTEFEEQQRIAKEQLKNKANQVSAKVQDTATKAKKEANKVVENAKQGMDNVTTEVSRKADVVKDKAQTQVQNVAKELPEKVENLKAQVNETAGNIKDAVVENAPKVRGSAIETASNVKESVAKNAGPVKDAAIKKGEEAKETVVNNAGPVKDAALKKGEEVKDAVVNNAGPIKDAAAEKAEEVYETVKNSVPSREAAQNAKEIVEEKAHDAVDTVSSSVGSTADSVKNTSKKVSESVDEQKDSVKSDTASKDSNGKSNKPPKLELKGSAPKLDHQRSSSSPSKSPTKNSKIPVSSSPKKESPVKKTTEDVAGKAKDVANTAAENLGLEGQNDRKGDSTESNESPVDDSQQQSWIHVKDEGDGTGQQADSTKYNKKSADSKDGSSYAAVAAEGVSDDTVNISSEPTPASSVFDAVNDKDNSSNGNEHIKTIPAESASLEKVRSSDTSGDTQGESDAGADSQPASTVASPSKKSKKQRQKEKAKAQKEKEKEQQDKIIDESEPVRDEVKDTDTSKDKGDEVGA